MLSALLSGLAGVGLAGCSSAALDSPYPAVHDMPMSRPDTPMTPDELKRATDVLLSDRDRLSADAQAATTTGSIPAGTQPAPQPAVSASAKTQKTGAAAKP